MIIFSLFNNIVFLTSLRLLKLAEVVFNLSNLLFKLLKQLGKFFDLSTSNLSKSGLKLAKSVFLAKSDVSKPVVFFKSDFGYGYVVLGSNSFYVKIYFLTIYLLKKLFTSFLLTYILLPSCLDYFFNSKLWLICFLQFFFIKRSNNYFSIKIFHYIRPWNGIFNIFNL